MKSLFKLVLASSLFALAMLTTSTSWASDAVCPNSGILSAALFDKFCWSCIFPLRLLRLPIGSGGTNIQTKGGPPITGGPSAPPGASGSAYCACKDNFGVPMPGFTVGGWLPTRLVEVVRMPWCSTVLGKTLINNPRLLGGHKSVENDNSDKIYYNTHYIAFPIAYILQMLVDHTCNQGDYGTLAFVTFSEVDPTKQSDELAMWFNPMSVIFSQPAAFLAGMADCAASTAGYPMSSLPGCMGCLGMLTPGSNNVSSKQSPPQYTALLAGRELMTAHLRGFARKTYGSSDAQCGGVIWPIIPKEQYRISQFYPVPQAAKPCCDAFGQTQMFSREFRNIPAVGEDFMYVIFQYTECCAAPY
ncbi:TraU family protein [Duganella vulcania]|uniref:Conjugal transfer protein n=1 Tax=Duganella vulcania TaxID=2692166 RepID=A0A845GI27_9BURK|nr:TraU family protein [Duganella vulcania]MYM92708.1 hypothetical protein [Duganella vulcania]